MLTVPGPRAEGESLERVGGYLFISLHPLWHRSDATLLQVSVYLMMKLAWGSVLLFLNLTLLSLPVLQCPKLLITDQSANHFHTVESRSWCYRNHHALSSSSLSCNLKPGQSQGLILVAFFKLNLALQKGVVLSGLNLCKIPLK